MDNDATRIIKMPAHAVPANAGRTQMTLDEIEARIHGGEAMLECAWELLRERNFPGREPDAAAAQLGKWALSRRIEVEFDHRPRADGDEVDIHVLFTAADPLFWPRLLHAATD